MELRVLSYFLAAAREENITKAARILHVTQPTLSRQIMQLEEELGVKLFKRSNHNIILTEDGMLLKCRAQELLSLADKTKRDFLHREDEITGEISIGSGEFQSTSCLAELIASFRSTHPLIRYEICSGNADNISDKIEQGILDMGLMLEPADIRKYDFIPMPCRETWGILVREDSDLADKESVGPEDLLNRPLIASAGGFAQSSLGKWFGAHRNQMDIAAAGNLLYNEAMLARSGIGIVLCIRLNCTYDGLKFIPLSPALETGSVLAWKKDQIFSPAAAAFLEYAKKYAEGMTDHKI